MGNVKSNMIEKVGITSTVSAANLFAVLPITGEHKIKGD
ncbi:hypothetical protein SRABI96_02156 [Peribacillus sp. Bi96]|nr:hypothetical protein SRABI96_02156 [Peribacillus sp. Bi96]